MASVTKSRKIIQKAVPAVPEISETEYTLKLSKREIGVIQFLMGFENAIPKFLEKGNQFQYLFINDFIGNDNLKATDFTETMRQLYATIEKEGV